MLCKFNHKITILQNMFRHFILDFECNEIIGTIYGSDDKFASHFQKVLILKELQKNP